MNITGEKISRLIEVYGESKGYPVKSYLRMFCDDFNVNYSQWNAYTREKQSIGTKIIDILMEIFPDLNLNWLLKDELNMFLGKDNLTVISEPEPKYSKKIDQEDIYNKLEDILVELKKVTRK